MVMLHSMWGGVWVIWFLLLGSGMLCF
ncbi:hypothetical protein AKJ16_DCAP15321 [Drosera capensis]